MLALFKTNPILLLIARGWHYAGKRRRSIVAYTLMFVLAMVITLFEPYVIGRILNAVQKDAVATKSGAQIWHDVSTSLYLFFSLQFLFWAVHGPARVIERFTAFYIKAAYKKDLFATVTALPVTWHRQHHSGESIDKINRAALALGTFYDLSFQVIYMTMRLLGPLVVLFFLDPFAGWVGLATAAVAFLNIYLWDVRLYKHYFQINRLENLVASAVHDYVTNIGSVITLRLENRVTDEVTQRMFGPLKVFRTNVAAVEVKWFITTMLIAVMTLVVLLTYAHGLISTGQMVLGGTFYTLFEYLRRIGLSFYDFASLYGTIVRQAADVESADTIFGAIPSKSGSPADALPANWHQLTIKNLRFRYEDEKHRIHHLDDICLELHLGKAIALVGESGAGKSTLLALLRGLQEPLSVTVTCDGKTLPDKLAHLTAHTTLIPQDPEIFADTIRFNITFGLEANDADVLQAIKLACFEPVLLRLPNGLDTNIAEKGINLSGGEKQRLALARGIFFAKESEILLLDEPTSSVDTLNEQTIFSNLLSVYRNKCIITAVHKLHLLPLFDSIYVFNDGKIIEQGTFEDLISKAGLLAKMWQHYQASSNAEEPCPVIPKT